jgi:hypothetical protein
LENRLRLDAPAMFNLHKKTYALHINFTIFYVLCGLAASSDLLISMNFR